MTQYPTDPAHPGNPGPYDVPQGAQTTTPKKKRRWVPWAVGVGIFFVGVMVGTSGDGAEEVAAPEPAPTVTVTAEPEPAETVEVEVPGPTVTETVEVEAAVEEELDADTQAMIFDLAIRSTYDQMSTSEQVTFCQGIDDLGMDFALNAIEGGWNTDDAGLEFDRDIASTVLTEVCA